MTQQRRKTSTKPRERTSVRGECFYPIAKSTESKGGDDKKKKMLKFLFCFRFHFRFFFFFFYRVTNLACRSTSPAHAHTRSASSVGELSGEETT